MIQPDPQRPYLFGHYAGFATRFIAILLDGLIIALILSVIGLGVRTIPGLIELSTLVNPLNVLPAETRLWIQLYGFGAGTIVLALSYNVFWLATIGRTPGKYVMGLRVVTVRGGRLNIFRALLRTVGYSVSGIVTLFFGFLMVLIDSRRQALHDKLAQTCVVYNWEARQDESFLAEQLQQMADEAHHRSQKR